MEEEALEFDFRLEHIMHTPIANINTPTPMALPTIISAIAVAFLKI